MIWDKEIQSGQYRLRQKNILEKSGIKKLFEDFVTSGVVSLSNAPAIADIFTKRWFHDEYKSVGCHVIAEHTPAKIVITDTTISLLYDYIILNRICDGRAVRLDYHKELRFEVKNNVIYLVSLDTKNVQHKLPENTRYTYTALDNNLEKLIAHGFKHPLLIEGRGYEKKPTKYQDKMRFKEWLIYWLAKVFLK